VIELVYPNPAVPYFIAWLALAYSLLTFACMFLFGRECWLERGEVSRRCSAHSRVLRQSRYEPAPVAESGCGHSAPG